MATKAGTVRAGLLALLVMVVGCETYTPEAISIRRLAVPPPSRPVTDPDTVLFLVLGDAGRGNSAQAAVGRFMSDVCEKRRPDRGCDFALVTGDLIYSSGVSGVNDTKFQSHFEAPFAALGELPMWSVAGNHDWGQSGSVQAEIDYTANSRRWRMPFYHFAVGGLPEWLHIYGLDTAIIDDLGRARGADLAPLRDAAEAEVKAAVEALCGQPGWRLLFGHHPVYSSGQHGRDNGPDGVDSGMHAALVEPLIGHCGVQVYFAGHDHMQEHLAASAEGFEQVIQGAASEVRSNDRDVEVDGVTSMFRARKYGFALVTATRKSLAVEFYGFQGARGPTPDEQLPIHEFELQGDAP